MLNNIPLISVVMITYQHEKYIAEAIRSILDQTFNNFELIIVNDGSTDKTDEIIKGFHDNRITYIYQENQGPSTASSNGILASRGEYIAFMSGDDVSYPQRLEVQYQYLKEFNVRIAFSWIDVINDDSQLLKNHPLQRYFNKISNRSRPEILNSFFFTGNDLCALTAILERQILLDCGLFKLTSIQMQDFDMWIKIVKKFDIAMIEEKLIKYRVRGNLNNLSMKPELVIRNLFEGYQVYRNIFDDVPIDLFKLSFPDQIKLPEFQDGNEYELEKSFLFLHHPIPLFQTLGVERLFAQLQNQEILNISKSKYNFGLPELYNLMKDADITGMKKSIFWKLGNIWFRIKNNIFGS